MNKRFFILDCMALVYRAHYAFRSQSIRTSKGFNTSAIYGFANTLLDLIQGEKPTHIAVATDSPTPTFRHILYPEYKAHREAMPEELVAAIPYIYRMIEAFEIPLLINEGFEADDLIGSAVAKAPSNFHCFMVTSDKDFGQLVNKNVFIYRPSTSFAPTQIWGVSEVLKKWGIQSTQQVIDILGLMGDASDNIPGVPGIGEKTASKLIYEYGSIENLLQNASSVKGKHSLTLLQNQESALLSKRLATISLNAPVPDSMDPYEVKRPNLEKLNALLEELEFKSLIKKISNYYGESVPVIPSDTGVSLTPINPTPSPVQTLLLSEETTPVDPATSDTPHPFRNSRNTPHSYRIANDESSIQELQQGLSKARAFCFDLETTGLDPKTCRPIGIAFSWEAHTGWYLPLPENHQSLTDALNKITPYLQNGRVEKVGHNLKFDLAVLRWNGIKVKGPFFDTMIAHTLLEPEARHGMDDLSRTLLSYNPIPISALIGDPEIRTMAEVPLGEVAEYAAEDADVTWQLRNDLGKTLSASGLERVFYHVEMPLLPVLTEMEFVGIKVDASALAEFSKQLSGSILELRNRITELAQCDFNLNSPKQLGEVLFEKLQLSDKPKKTKTGQYATDEATLESLALNHEIAKKIVEFRTVSKLKSTYADALPESIFRPTQRVHTTYSQVVTTTGRLNSQNPTLQNIPIRSDLGQEIRRAFVVGSSDLRLMSADYSQIELRVIAALSKDQGLIEAFKSGKDIHTATAAAVHGIMEEFVTSEMRRTAKMVNFGIIYGISAFGLSQRLGISRSAAAKIIENYFAMFPGVKRYMEACVAFARDKGFVETLTGRRRYLREINSNNATARSAAERIAINTPVQGTAADLIKIAMSKVALAIEQTQLKSRMLLQVHDELLLESPVEELDPLATLVRENMQNALPLGVPIEVNIGVGSNWLEAHS